MIQYIPDAAKRETPQAERYGPQPNDAEAGLGAVPWSGCGGCHGIGRALTGL